MHIFVLAGLNETVSSIKTTTCATKFKQVGSIGHSITELYKLDSVDKPSYVSFSSTEQKNVENLFSVLLAGLGRSKCLR
jgi:hypothetical protein